MAQTLERLRAMAKDPGRFAILLQPGAGPVSERAIKLIREGLASDPRFVWTVVTKQNEAPVADANNPGQHVHGVSWRLDPPPRLVLSVGASDGTLYIAAREPGRDPLGGPTDGWLWVLSSPLTMRVVCFVPRCPRDRVNLAKQASGSVVDARHLAFRSLRKRASRRHLAFPSLPG